MSTEISKLGSLSNFAETDNLDSTSNFAEFNLELSGNKSKQVMFIPEFNRDIW
jgi:hypothetical protein